MPPLNEANLVRVKRRLTTRQLRASPGETDVNPAFDGQAEFRFNLEAVGSQGTGLFQAPSLVE